MNAELSSWPAEPIVAIDRLSRRFGATKALDDVTLTIPRGVVLGLVGTNGAGKTTLIKHMLGLLRAERGQVAMFGLDPVAEPAAVLARVGYLAEVNELPDWMRVHEVIRFIRAFYSSWDESYAEALRRTFELDTGALVRELSKGQRARLALLLALAHRPELLLLDEPSSGLDPLVRRDILHAIIKTVSEEGRTVLFSSHLLDEVERVADHVAIIDKGSIIQNASLESLKAGFQRLEVLFAEAPEAPPSAGGFFHWRGSERHWQAFYRGSADDAERMTSRLDAELLECATPSLNEIFVALVGARERQERGA